MSDLTQPTFYTQYKHRVELAHKVFEVSALRALDLELAHGSRAPVREIASVGRRAKPRGPVCSHEESGDVEDFGKVLRWAWDRAFQSWADEILLRANATNSEAVTQ
jgi:hypothetical protein